MGWLDIAANSLHGTLRSMSIGPISRKGWRVHIGACEMQAGILRVPQAFPRVAAVTVKPRANQRVTGISMLLIIHSFS